MPRFNMTFALFAATATITSLAVSPVHGAVPGGGANAGAGSATVVEQSREAVGPRERITAVSATPKESLRLTAAKRVAIRRHQAAAVDALEGLEPGTVPSWTVRSLSGYSVGGALTHRQCQRLADAANAIVDSKYQPDNTGGVDKSLDLAATSIVKVGEGLGCRFGGTPGK